MKSYCLVVLLMVGVGWGQGQPPSAKGTTRIVCQDGQLQVSVDGAAYRNLYDAEGKHGKCEMASEDIGKSLHWAWSDDEKASWLNRYIEKHCYIRPGFYDIKCDQ